MEKIIKIKTKQSVKIAHFYDPSDEKTTLLDPIKLDKNQNHVMVFDDIMLEDLTMIKKYFCLGRHNNVNVFYLVQSLHKLPNTAFAKTPTCLFFSSKMTGH